MDFEQIKKEAQEKNIPYEKMGRVLVWYDQFDEGKLDRTKWSFQRSMGASDRDYDNSEKHCRIEGDKLLMQVHRSDKEGINYSLPEGFCTDKTMNFKYGYAEMRAKLPYRHGAWPSFWMKSNTPFMKAPYMSEVDIFEVFSSDRNAVANLHRWGGGKHCMLRGGEGSLTRAYTFEKYENLNDEYHIYGFEWNEKMMAFYVDDVKYAEFPIDETGADQYWPEDVFPGDMTGFHDFHYLIMNNEIFSPGSGWKPEGCVLTEDDPMPINYYIDWVRLYQDPKTEEIKLMDEIAQASKK